MNISCNGAGNLPLRVSLQDVEVEIIKARSPSSPHLVSLAPSDIMVGGAISTAMVAVFWPASKTHDKTVLIAGLSAALDGYPIFVGRLQTGGKVSCANQGIPVTTAISPRSLSDFMPPGPSAVLHIPINLEEVLHQVPSTLTPESPMLGITIAGLACGGMSIMLTFHHVVADMHSIRQLMYDWAIASKAISGGETAPMLAAYSCGRHPYDALVMGLSSSMAPAEPLSSDFCHASSAWAMVPKKDSPYETPIGHGSVMVFFSKQRLAELKAEAMSQLQKADSFVSTNDAMAARMRQVLAKLPCRGVSQPKTMHFACEQRGRVKSAAGLSFVEETFIGNCASACLTEPLDPTVESLGTLALSMRSAIQTMPDVACREYAWIWEHERRYGYEHLWTATPANLDKTSDFPAFGISNWDFNNASSLDMGSGPAVWLQSGYCMPVEICIILPAIHPDYAGGCFGQMYAPAKVIQELLAVSHEM